MLKLENSLFGTRRRTEALLALAMMEETYARELSRVLGAPLVTVQRVLDKLEAEGIVASQLVGNQRRVRLNPRYFAREELRELLLKVSAGERELTAKVEALRRRPRRKGKEL